MAVFYWNNNGRLGNLLFQYAAILRYTSSKDRVYSFHHGAFDLLDTDGRFKIIPSSGRVGRRVNLWTNQFTAFAAGQRWVGSIEPESQIVSEAHRAESANVRRVTGFLPRHFVLQGYFQVGDAHKTQITVKPGLIRSAEVRLRAATAANVTVAVHIRLTDYGTWPVLGHLGVIVPAAWYEDRMKELKERLESPTFIVFSDDMPSAKRLFPGKDVVFAEARSAVEDLVAMALCSHAIISPSSFAWWAACAFQRSDKIVMAPEYWAGFKSHTWYPPSMMTEGIEYYPVPG